MAGVVVAAGLDGEVVDAEAVAVEVVQEPLHLAALVAEEVLDANRREACGEGAASGTWLAARRGGWELRPPPAARGRTMHDQALREVGEV